MPRSAAASAQRLLSPATISTVPKHAMLWDSPLAEFKSLVSCVAYAAHLLPESKFTTSSMSISVLHAASESERASVLSASFNLPTWSSHDESRVLGFTRTLTPKPMALHVKPESNGVVLVLVVLVLVLVVVDVEVDVLVDVVVEVEVVEVEVVEVGVVVGVVTSQVVNPSRV